MTTLGRALRRIAQGKALSSLDVPLIEEAADQVDALKALVNAANTVVWWNDRVGAMCEPEDERDVLEPLRAAIAKAEGR
jgi:hypothetical protein